MTLRVPPLQIEGLLQALAAHDVEFVIIGGFSLSVHGVVRGTKDVDIVPAPDAANLQRLAYALAAIEAEPLLADDFDPAELGLEPNFEGLSSGGNWVLRTNLGRLDVMQDVPGVRGFAQLAEGAIDADVPGAGRFRFAGLDDLIAMKTAAGRPQDEIDIVSLERARNSGP
jgi:predicted nucleotidyltransferase